MRYIQWYFLLFLLCCTRTSVFAGDTVNVMVAATPGAIAGLGGGAAAKQQVFAAIGNINQSFVNSRIDGYVKLVCTYQFNESDPFCMYDFLNRVVTLNGSEMLRLQTKRNIYSADVVVVIVDEPSQCGISGVYGNGAQAFIVVHYGCIGANYSMARQLGYLLGCGNNEDQSGRFNFENETAQGYIYLEEEDINGVSFATIMGYTDETLSSNEDDFDMIPYWSTSDTTVRYHNKPVGDAEHDNAAQVRLGLARVAAYKEEFGLLRAANVDVAPYNVANLRVRQRLDISNSYIEDRSDARFNAKRIRLMDGVRIKRGAHVQIGIPHWGLVDDHQ